jgi:hypothetical protein
MRRRLSRSSRSTTTSAWSWPPMQVALPRLSYELEKDQKLHSSLEPCTEKKKPEKNKIWNKFQRNK